MLIVLYVVAGIFAALFLATVALSGNWLATGIRGTLRQGVLGVAFIAPVALILAAFVVAVYAVISSILYVLDLVE